MYHKLAAADRSCQTPCHGCRARIEKRLENNEKLFYQTTYPTVSLSPPLSIPSETKINANFFNHTAPLDARCAASKKQRSSLCRSHRMQLWYSHYPAR